MAPLSSSLVARLKVQLKLSISRLRMTQQRDMALAKQQRRAMALLLEQCKVESARIRVENIIRSDIMTELHEILELYCELLLARSQLLETNMNTPSFASSISNATASALTSKKSIATASSAKAITPPDLLNATQDPGLDEAIRSIIFAAPRTDVKELMQVRQLLLEKFGKEVGLQAVEGVGVAERVLKKLIVETPAKRLVDAYLGEIARTYGIAWPDGEDEDDDDDSDHSSDEGDEPSSGQKILLNHRKYEEEWPEEQIEQPLTTDVIQTTEITASASAAATSTPTSTTAIDERDQEEQLRLRSASSPPRGNVTDHASSALRINPPSSSTENAQPRLTLPGPPNGKPSGETTKRKKKGKKEKNKNSNTTKMVVVKNGDDTSSMMKIGDKNVDGERQKSRMTETGQIRRDKLDAGDSNSANSDNGAGGRIPDVDELMRRFAELK